MSTQFTLYALADEDVPAARAYMAGSLGYGNDPKAALEYVYTTTYAERLAILDRPVERFIVDGEHDTLHGRDPSCVAHKISDFLDGSLPPIDDRLAAVVLDFVPARWSKVPDTRDRLRAWLRQQAGKRLWYVYE